MSEAAVRRFLCFAVAALAMVAPARGDDAPKQLAPPVQMTRRPMVQRVVPTPLVVGRERENAGREPHDVVGHAGLEERAVAAVVEDDEDAGDERNLRRL